MGPLMIDVAGLELTQQERQTLADPRVGGVILFTRNFQSISQLRVLIADIRASTPQGVLIAVDHEGGRVQRFRDGFTQIPAMGALTQLAAQNDEALAKACGIIMAYELRQLDIDISFAPVLDIDDVSEVIGDRAFANNPVDVERLSGPFIDGMAAMGMPATGKHFPGHGSVAADSHIAKPVDTRTLEQILAIDLPPFEAMCRAGKLGAMMPAHVIYPAVDDLPAGFSSVWLQQILRQELGFDGVIFSDDLSMDGAASVGGFAERAEAALKAGCDMLLVCNNPDAAHIVLESLAPQPVNPRLAKLKPAPLASDAQQQYEAALAIWRQYVD